jgi:uncharacterized protein YkwD
MHLHCSYKSILISFTIIIAWLLALNPASWPIASADTGSSEALLPPVSIERENIDPAIIVSPAYSGCHVVTAPISNADYEQQIVELVNAERASRSLPPLKRIDELDRAARYHSTDLAQDNYFQHDSYDRVGGNLTRVCYWYERVGLYYLDWSSMGENIAGGYSTPDSAMAAWMGSTGHRNNILSTTYREIGVGYYYGSQGYAHYWTQDFGRRNSVYPLIINNEAANTDSRNVSVYIYDRSNPGWSEMRLRNDDEAWSAWQPFQSRFDWQLPNCVGTHTVTAEMRNATSNATSSDSIYLTECDAVELGGLPPTLTFRYSIPYQALYPISYQLAPKNTADDQMISWSISEALSWLDTTPDNGSTPQSFSVVVSGFDQDTVGSYTGDITVTATDPPGVLNSPFVIQVTLDVIDSPVYQIQMPLVFK